MKKTDNIFMPVAAIFTFIILLTAVIPAFALDTQSLFITRLSSRTALESSGSTTEDVTSLMNDNMMNQGRRVQKSKGKYDILSFRSNVDTVQFSSLVLSVYVNNIYTQGHISDGWGTQPAQIYAYNSDGNSVQSSLVLEFTISYGWNDLDVTKLLPLMKGFGFVKFRIVAVRNWFDIAEARVSFINLSPVAVTNGPYAGIATKPVIFKSDGSYDPDGGAITFLWDFGDGNTSTQANPTHAYALPDTYTITLTVTDPEGKSDTDVTTATIINETFETIRPTDAYNLEGWMNPSNSFDWNLGTYTYKETPNTTPSISFGGFSSNESINAWQSKLNYWDAAWLYITFEGLNPATNDDLVEVVITDQNGNKKHTILAPTQGVWPRQEFVKRLNMSDWGNGFNNISNLRVRVNGYRQKGSDREESRVYDVRIDGDTSQFIKDYTRGAFISLPGNESNLTIDYKPSEINDVEKDDGNRVSQDGSVNQYLIHQFKQKVSSHSITMKWNGQINESGVEAYIYLEAYNRVTSSWSRLDTALYDGSTSDIDLSATVSSADFFDTNGWIAVRVYTTAGDALTSLSTDLIAFSETGEKISVVPPTLDFGSVEITRSSSQSLTVSNKGIGNLVIGALTIPSSPFSITSDGCSGKTLFPSASCQVTVSFTPIAAGTFTDVLTIPSDDPINPSVIVNLTGIGTLLPATLTGMVTDSTTGLPVSNVTVTVTDSLKTFTTTTSSNGIYFISGLTQGSFTATFVKSGYIQQTVNGAITAGQTLTLNIQLTPIPPLTITITSPQDGAVVSSSPITVSGTVSNNANVTVNGIQASVSNNTFSATISLIEGQNTITATAIDQYSQTASHSIKVTLMTKGTITGTVTDSSTGQPLASATVSVTDALNVTRTALTGTNGVYTISGIAQGAFSGSISRSGYNTYTFTGTITAGQTLTINAALTPQFPIISDITVSDITTDSATISWTTDQPSSTLFEYGTTTSYGTSYTDPTLTSGYSLTLTNLASGTTYHFKITSTNAYGFSSSSGDNTFATLSTPEFTTVTIGDYGNVTVMEVEGNYDAKKPDGTINTVPRQEIAKEFFRLHQDDHDFIIILSNFDFAMPDPEAKGFYLEVKNDTEGIGKELFDYSDLFGSNGILQGTIDMGNIVNLPTNPFDPNFEQTVNTIGHEMMHRWVAYVKFKDANGNISTALLGKDSSHWSFLLDTDASLLYGNEWQDNGNGTFTSIGANKYYSPLDLYLMGLYDKTEVPQMLLIDNPNIDPARLPEVGVTISGTPQYITIDDIIEAEGERIPGPSESQKTFKIGFILVTAPGTFTGNEISGIENIRNGWAGSFSELTYGEGSIEDVTPSLTVYISSPSNGDTITRPDVTVRGTIINSTGKETGITVNGIVANVYGNQFTVSRVPLTVGPNTITATATDTAGKTATTSITVNEVTTGNYIRISANPESGIPPLETILRIDGSFSMDNSSISVSGPALPVVLSSSVEEYRVKMIVEGIYYFTASVTGPDGLVYTDIVAVTVMNKTELDKLLRAKWNAMNNALSAGDISTALTYIFPSSKTAYQIIFNALAGQLPSIVAAQTEFNFISVRNGVAKYELVVSENGKTYSYKVIFENGSDGIWMIKEY